VSSFDIAVVGGGLATARFVKGYREAGGTDAILIVSSDDAVPYHRPPLSKRYLRGEIEARETFVEPESFYAEHNAELRLSTTVAGLGDGELELEDGERVSFGRLVIASGATPRRLDVPGAGLDSVHTLRRLADSAAIRERARESKRAVCIGSNFIGLEVAASLTALGLEVALLDRGTQLFRALEAPQFSEYLDRLYREKGVEVHYEDEAAEFREGKVVTKKGLELEADLAVVGIGVTPAVGWLEGSGVEVDDGVVVNERFETSVHGVYAVGDVARFYDPVFGRSRRIEHWSNANYQGAELGKLLATAEGGYDVVSSFFSELHGVSVRFFGDATGHDGQELDGSFEKGEAVLLYLAGGTIVAALTMGQEDDANERLKDLIRSRAPLSAYR
jgi:NADPH-dependent 2,4-dienoyl-CoA reductase/sulfur reductase-like enzyme